jgi:RNA polymerase sigma-70 factor (ECF subfamily)
MNDPDHKLQPFGETTRRVAEKVIPPTDDQLWQQVRTSLEDISALTQLYQRWRSPLVILASRRSVDADRAEDLLNESFAKLLRRRDRFDTHTRAFAYLWRCIERGCWRLWRVDRCRAEGERIAANRIASTKNGPQSDAAIQLEISAAIDAALGQLSDGERQSVVLHHLLGWSVPQVADSMNVKPATVDTFLNRAKEKLCRLLAKWSPVVVPAGAVGLESMLSNVARASEATPARLSTSVQAILSKVISSNGTVKWFVQLMLGICLASGVAIGAWSAMRSEGSALPQEAKLQAGAVLDAPHEAPKPETVPQRNLRLFMSMVMPRQLEALHELTVGNGEVTVAEGSLKAYETRLECTYLLHHRPKDGEPWVSYLRLSHHVERRLSRVEIDLHGTGKLKEIDPEKPVYWSLLSGETKVLQIQALTRAIQAFQSLPKDQQSATEWNAQKERFRKALLPFCGQWFRKGLASHPCGAYVNDDQFVLVNDRQKSEAVFANGVTIKDDGSFEGVVLFGSPIELSPDSQRLNFPKTGEWWTREPTTNH